MVPMKTTVARAEKIPLTAANIRAPQDGSKTSRVVALLKREGGTTLEEIMTYPSHCTSLGRSEGFSLTESLG